MLEKITIFSDGSSLGNPGPGGYGVIMRWKDQEIKISEGFRKTTNNRMELLGPITALKKLKKPQNVLITTDSRYVIDGIEKGWAKKWKQNNWMRDKKNKALNSDLWELLIDQCDYHLSVKFKWVKG
ncbi:MAG: ribonuclease HI, partial [SAR202 cluster bacterium]|nr:ribonuclease HI [SAR202 cluster bacterium]